MNKAAIASGVTIGLFEAIGSKIVARLYDYGKKQMEEIQQLRDLYIDCCWPLERESLPTTLIPNFVPEDDENNNRFPIYFQMDRNEKKKPVFYVKQLRTITSPEPWEKNVSTASFLSNIIKDMINRICNYQIRRGQGIVQPTENFGIGGKGFYYDPTNLFFEEFKLWLVELSKAPLNEATLDVVEGRINFLRAIDVRQVFKQSKKDVTRHKTVIRLLDDLQKHVQPLITSTIAAEGAREHFKSLTINLSAIIRDISKFCFYIYRDSKNTPQAFVYREVQQAGLNFKPIVNETQSGQLLFQLLNCPLAKLSRTLHQDNPNQPLQITFGEEKIRAFEWDESDKANDIGILKVFAFNRDIMLHFFKLHHLLERLYVFQKITKYLHYFAGEGGNLLVYGYAASQVRHILNCYRELVTELEATIHYLHTAADLHRRKLIDNNKPTAPESRWMKLFTLAEQSYQSLFRRHTGLLPNTLKLIRSIEDKMEVVNTPAYISKLRNEVKSFTRWISIFTGEEIDTLEAPTHQTHMLLKGRKKPQRRSLEAFAEKVPRENVYRVDIDGEILVLKQKSLSINVDNGFRALGYSRKSALDALFDVCEQQPFITYITDEICQIFDNKELPEEFADFELTQKYNKLIRSKSTREAKSVLNHLCLKTSGFIARYVTCQYNNTKNGLLYFPESRGVVHALAAISKHDLQIFSLDSESATLVLIDKFICPDAKQSPVYLLQCGQLDENEDTPCFNILLDISKPSFTNQSQSFFEKDDEFLYKRAKELYDVSQSPAQTAEQHLDNLTGAIGCLDLLVRRHPKNVDYLLLRGICSASTLDPAKRKLALGDFNAALDYCGDNQKSRIRVLTERGITHQYMWNADQALADFDRILELDPNNRDIRLRRAKLVLDERLDFKQAFEDYGYILKSDPEDIETLKARFIASTLAKDFELAKKDAATLMRLCPEDDEVKKMFADAIEKAGQSDNPPNIDEDTKRKCVFM